MCAARDVNVPDLAIQANFHMQSLARFNGIIRWEKINKNAKS